MEPSKKTASVVGDTNIHLDFHTPPFQRDVGVNFDAERFARRLDEANVDSVTFFAKGCHGSTYYDSKVGPIHPQLKGNMLAEAIEACHERDIAVLAYYTLAWDNLPGKENPDWYQRDGEGNALNATSVDDRWEWLCLNSPYTDELVHPHVREILQYDIDGFWFDILVYHRDACTCRYCVRSMKSKGLDPGDADDRRIHRTQVCRDFVEQTTGMIKAHDEDLVVTYNHRLNLGLTTSFDEYMDYVVIESLPSGWGYMHTPTFARYTRNLDRPVQGMTGIFHKVWGDFGTVKSEAQLKYELSNSLSHHLATSIGDQLRPRGELEKSKYETIGDAFSFAKERSLPAADPVRDIAVVAPGHTDPAGRESGMNADDPEMSTNSAVAATKLLCDTHQQFDVLDEYLAQRHLDEFELVVLADAGELEPETIETVRSFVAGGGNLLTTGTSSLTTDELALGDVLGIRHLGQLPYTSAYFGLEDYDEDVPEIECVSYGPFQRVALDGATPKAWVVAPTTERSETRRFSHFQAPPERTLDVPAVTHHEYGDGVAIYVGTNLVSQYYREAYHAHRTLLDTLVTDLQDVRMLDADAPTSVEVNAMTTGDDIYLHLLNYHTSRAGESLAQIDATLTVRDVSVTVYAPDRTEVTPVTDVGVTSERDGEYVRVEIDELGTHEIVKIT
ncbi:beta-galactosidase trimerization domain-containing protein [Haladaptatus sp. CMAA 1911]|uniref:beta-galactosidase trimerization domain-containing protein n=1 Tax=unclassified Haladaptatus TaxID=2622732 RepID=UPI003754C737